MVLRGVHYNTFFGRTTILALARFVVRFMIKVGIVITNVAKEGWEGGGNELASVFCYPKQEGT